MLKTVSTAGLVDTALMFCLEAGVGRFGKYKARCPDALQRTSFVQFLCYKGFV